MRPVVGSVEPVADLITRGFHDDPPPVWWYPDPVERDEQMLAFWRAFATLGLSAGDGLMSEDGDAVALYVPPEAVVDESMVDAAGLPAAVAGMGPTRASQIGSFLEVLDRLHAETMPEPHWELSCVAVAPASQGRGLGVALVDEMTLRARRDGVPCFLVTAAERNLSFYERRGYHVAQQAAVTDSPLQVWAMRLD